MDKSAASPRPPWHGNWYREWRVGRFAFEIEWVPRARYYVFSFTINTPEADLRRGIIPFTQERGPERALHSSRCTDTEVRPSSRGRSA